MPSTKPGQDRTAKRSELVDAARRLFVTDGYDATSMAALAREARVAANTIYWYFGDKDDVLIAVLDAVLADAMADYATVAEQPLREQLSWTVDRLRQLRRLVTTVHARLGRSEALNAWHDAFHATTEGLLGAALERTMDPAAIDAEVRIAAFTVEGLLTHDLPPQERRAVCEQLAARWSSRPQPAGPPAVTLRPVTPDDVDGLVAVAARGTLPADVMPPDDDPAPTLWTAARRDRYAAFLRSRLGVLPDGRRERSFLVLADDRVTGVARLAGPNGAVPIDFEVGLWLVRAARGRGIGRTTIEQLGARARDLGGGALTAETAVDGFAAQELLRRQGAVFRDVAPGVLGARVDLR